MTEHAAVSYTHLDVYKRQTLHIEDEFIRAALDEEETVRIDAEEDQTLVLVDIPIVSAERSSFM